MHKTLRVIFHSKIEAPLKTGFTGRSSLGIILYDENEVHILNKDIMFEYVIAHEMAHAKYRKYFYPLPHNGVLFLFPVIMISTVFATFMTHSTFFINVFGYFIVAFSLYVFLNSELSEFFANRSAKELMEKKNFGQD